MATKMAKKMSPRIAYHIGPRIQMIANNFSSSPPKTNNGIPIRVQINPDRELNKVTTLLDCRMEIRVICFFLEFGWS